MSYSKHSDRASRHSISNCINKSLEQRVIDFDKAPDELKEKMARKIVDYNGEHGLYLGAAALVETASLHVAPGSDKQTYLFAEAGTYANKAVSLGRTHRDPSVVNFKAQQLVDDIPIMFNIHGPQQLPSTDVINKNYQASLKTAQWQLDTLLKPVGQLSRLHRAGLVGGIAESAVRLLSQRYALQNSDDSVRLVPTTSHLTQDRGVSGSRPLNEHWDITTYTQPDQAHNPGIAHKIQVKARTQGDKHYAEDITVITISKVALDSDVNPNFSWVISDLLEERDDPQARITRRLNRRTELLMGHLAQQNF